MAKITRIKAKDPGKNSENSPEEPLAAPKTVAKVKVGSSGSKSKKAPKTPEKALKTPEKASKTSAKTPVAPDQSSKSAKKKPFILIRPFVAFGRYVKASWLEIRQVRWPNRKATWKMVAAIFVYTGLFIAIIMLLDALFTWLFGLLLG